jgi:hypothetical protein
MTANTLQGAKVTVQRPGVNPAYSNACPQILHIHIDLVRPPPASSQGFSYLLTMVNRLIRLIEAEPMKDISIFSSVDAFISTWVARFGVLATWTSDHGSEFTWGGPGLLCNCLGIAHTTKTAYPA